MRDITEYPCVCVCMCLCSKRSENERKGNRYNLACAWPSVIYTHAGPFMPSNFLGSTASLLRPERESRESVLPAISYAVTATALCMCGWMVRFAWLREVNSEM